MEPKVLWGRGQIQGGKCSRNEKSVRTSRLKESCQNTKSCFESLNTWSVFALTSDKQEKQSPPNPLVPSPYAFEHNPGKALPTSADVLIAFKASCSRWVRPKQAMDVLSRPRSSQPTPLVPIVPKFSKSNMGLRMTCMFTCPLDMCIFLHVG